MTLQTVRVVCKVAPDGACLRVWTALPAPETPESSSPIFGYGVASVHVWPQSLTSETGVEVLDVKHV